MANILYIEPDKVLAGIHAQAFRAHGHEVMLCAGAQSAIHAADQSRPDVVVLEVQLVEHSGIEFLYEFRSYPDWQGVPVIIFSAVPPSEFAASQEILKAELGIKKYFYKPQTSLKKLLDAVNKSISVST